MADLSAKLGMGVEAEVIRRIFPSKESDTHVLPPTNCALKFSQEAPDHLENYSCVFTYIDTQSATPYINTFVQIILEKTGRNLPDKDLLVDGCYIDTSKRPAIGYITDTPTTKGVTGVSHHLQSSLEKCLRESISSVGAASLWVPTIGTARSLTLPIEESLALTVGAVSSLAESLREKSDYTIAVELSIDPPHPKSKYEELVLAHGQRLVDENTFYPVEWIVYSDHRFPEYHKFAAENRLTNDGPAQEDMLGHKKISSALAAFLGKTGDASRATPLPVTIAIDGAWGTGKSTIMGFLKSELQGPEPKKQPRRRSGWFASLFILFNIFSLSVAEIYNRSVVQFWLWYHSNARMALDDEKRIQTEVPRSFETVWINAWRHGTGVRLKARVVHLIIKDLTERYGWQFLIELNLSRFSKAQLLRVAGQRLLSTFVMILIIGFAGLLLMTSAVDSFDPKNTASAFRNGLPGGVLFYYALSLLNSRMKSKSDVTFNDYFSQPNYEELVGADMEVEADFERILEVLAKRGKTLALFIDDLDRCSPSQVAEVIESLNVFFGKTDHKCVFILGMHFDLVAATLDVANEKIQKAIAENQGLAAQRPFGQRFLEKIVQFTVSVPPVSDVDVNQYVQYLATGSSRQKQQAAIQEALDFHNRLGEKSDSLSDQSALWEQHRNRLANEVENGEDLLNMIDDEISFKERIDTANTFSEEDPVVLLIFTSLQFALQRNPRQYKRFFNRFRFRNYIDQAVFSDSDGEYTEQLFNTAKSVVLELEFPLVSRWMAETGIRVSELHNMSEEIDFYEAFDGTDEHVTGEDPPPKSIEGTVARHYKTDTRLEELVRLTWDQIVKD